MSKSKLVSELRLLASELHEEEQLAKGLGNTLQASGLSLARIKLETIIEQHSGNRPISVDSECISAGGEHDRYLESNV
ncbi:hypothetical protein [Neptuniibacter sp. QD37_11]|uniref:hypothetical protein n=1 Tax=Neptuniibacter sp. QD37_11 TaxID=3398209 RepID=UPI0039F4DB3F